LVQQHIQGHRSQTVLAQGREKLLRQCFLRSMFGKNAATIPSSGR
jgi:hypothetical protein